MPHHHSLTADRATDCGAGVLRRARRVVSARCRWTRAGRVEGIGARRAKLLLQAAQALAVARAEEAVIADSNETFGQDML